jgi:hypothetical protein
METVTASQLERGMTIFDEDQAVILHITHVITHATNSRDTITIGGTEFAGDNARGPITLFYDIDDGGIYVLKRPTENPVMVYSTGSNPTGQLEE